MFRLGSEWLAVPAGMLDEVIAQRPTHALPHRRGHAAVGLVSVRGDIVVHVSLAGLLGISDDSATHADRRVHAVPRVVVVADDRGRLAFTADEVLGFHSYAPATLRPVPSTLAQAIRSYAVAMLAVGDRVVGVLDGASMVASLSLLLS
ncbi:MAG: chemotaxis protein CheW [Gemmatimonadaceae bacterium]